MRGVASRHPPGVVAICSGDLARYTAAMRSISNLSAPAGSLEHWWQSNNIANSINTAFKAMIDNPAYQWCWLMGDDHTFPEDVLLRLLDRDEDVVVPMCLNRYPPFDVTIVKGGKVKPLEEVPSGGLYRLGEGETVGDAGMLVRRRVIEAIDFPWYDRLRSGALGVDDQCFVERVKGAGFAVHVDLDVRIGHMSPFTMLPAWVDGRWVVRLGCGGQPVVDILPRRAP